MFARLLILAAFAIAGAVLALAIAGRGSGTGRICQTPEGASSAVYEPGADSRILDRTGCP